MINFNWLPVLDHFLCGYSLQTGVLFTGWLNLGSNVLQLLASVVYIIVYGREIPNWQLLLFSNVGVFLVSGSVNGLLLYGAYKSKPSCMVPFLILGGLGTILGAIAVTVSGIQVLLLNVVLAVIIFVIGGLLTGFAAYLWLVVYSYYQQLKNYSVGSVLNVAEDKDYMSHHKFVSWNM